MIIFLKAFNGKEFLTTYAQFPTSIVVINSLPLLTGINCQFPTSIVVINLPLNPYNCPMWGSYRLGFGRHTHRQCG